MDDAAAEFSSVTVDDFNDAAGVEYRPKI